MTRRDAAVARYDTAKEEIEDIKERLQLAIGYLEKAGLLDSEGEYDELAQQAMVEIEEARRAEIEAFERRLGDLNKEIER